MPKNQRSSESTFEAAALLSTKSTALPVPWEITNPQVIKEVEFWGTFFEKLPLSEEHLRTKFATRGELVVAFVAALHEVYAARGPPSTWVVMMFEKLAKVFVQLGDLFLLVRKEPSKYALLGKPFLEDARKIIRELDCDFIAKNNGKATAAAYRRSLSLDKKLFAESSGEALVAAKKARTESQRIYYDVDGAGALDPKNTPPPAAGLLDPPSLGGSPDGAALTPRGFSRGRGRGGFAGRSFRGRFRGGYRW